MKIEKISETQIRCLLTMQDLTERKMRISELAYGSEKAQDLFQEMMIQASNEFGFEVDDLPLMIEAVPVPPENLVLIITKVEEPDELDTRFSNFTLDSNSENDDMDDDSDSSDSFSQTSTSFSEPELETSSSFIKPVSGLPDKHNMQPGKKAFIFNSLDDVISLSKVIAKNYRVKSVLYKNRNSQYLLVLNFAGYSTDELYKVCNTASEYGTFVNLKAAAFDYYKEHLKTIVKSNALAVLAEM